ncbi:hypothetical protein [Hymenobacter psychrophilus]|uniref:Uncharacterized protein n=1 Tax=Hymenobacter psychrophilus TaxID=651662 RepID=A0A1H3FSX3_9BACT|nr:hypothetical protein [Hymenobacter psychrophilus]SDX94030.1 hypothetical protein SAMN04488069_104213 [Hymenobacter psychrophilus]
MNYKKLNGWARRAFFLLMFIILTQCRSDARWEQPVQTQIASDTLDVTAFNIEHETSSPELADWVLFEIGQEIICAPYGWKAKPRKHELALLPPSSTDSIERITFTRIYKNIDSLDYNAFARGISEKAFDGFAVQGADTLKKLVFQHDFAYERNVEFIYNTIAYKGYCIVYVDDRFVYKYQITLSNDRLNKYNGDLFKDIIGNLQINKKYIMRNENPLKQLIFVD